MPTVSLAVLHVNIGKKLVQCGHVDTKYISAFDEELEEVEVEVDEDDNSTGLKPWDPVSNGSWRHHLRQPR
jgi:hypothetical protein